MLKNVLRAGLCLSLAMCKGPGTPTTSGEPRPMAAKSGPASEILPPLAADKAPPASPRLPVGDDVRALGMSIDSYFAGRNARRIYIQVDKPLYKPGETIWVKTWDLKVRSQQGGDPVGMVVQLVDGRGAMVAQKRVQETGGTASNDFEIPADASGGEYQLRVRSDDGVSEMRPVVVSAYEAPRIKKKLEFLRKAYGPGDEVKATITVKRPTGEVLAAKRLQPVVVLDGAPVPAAAVTTDAKGGAVVTFALPKEIEHGDGLLSVMVEDGGITESVSKSIPIVLRKLQLSLFPEGGDLVEGLASRIYFEGKTPIGKPADLEGEIVDDQGQVAARLVTHQFGLGRAEFVPSPGRSYHVRITKPVGVTSEFPVPAARAEGCVLRAYDDLDGALGDLRVAVRCSTARTVFVTAVLRENHLDTAKVKVAPGAATVVYLHAADESLGRAQGIARVTVFDEEKNPLAERLVFRNRRRGLQVKLETDEKEYGPREQVAVTVKTTDDQGRPVPAEVALSVVDDTVVSFADDKTGHMQSRLLFEQEIPEKVEEPKFFFDLKEKKAAAALDMLMGTRGYRRFEWQPVFATANALADVATVAGGIAGLEKAERDGARGAGGPKGALRPFAVPAAARPAPPPAAAPAVQAPAPAKAARLEGRLDNLVAGLKRDAAPAEKAMPAHHQAKPKVGLAEGIGRAKDVKEAAAPRAQLAAGAEAKVVNADFGLVGNKKMNEADKPAAEPEMRRARAVADDELAMGEPAAPPPVVLAPVRVFPAPVYTGAFTGTRTDFRETIHWAPSVSTDNKGKAIVTFYLSDAVTSFRIFAEGAGGGLIGRTESVFKSSLPFSMSVKLPVEVSAGDRILMPLTLTNERNRNVPLQLHADFGALLKSEKTVAVEGGELKASARQSLFFPVTVGTTSGQSRVSFAADAGGLKDEFAREVTVVPLGFPQQISESGQLGANGRATVTIDTGAALPGTAVASVTLYPSPTSTLLSGLEGMIQEPGGCFEQTSSSNYPNVMVLDYLRTQDVADPELVERVNGMLERGYKKLTSFETQEKGYEWFGQSPGHEALTAYGVLEFADMKRVWGGVDQPMLTRTVAYLREKRDGKGGFKRNARALDSFGGAKDEVTNAYIVYAMSEAGFVDIGPEIAAQRKSSETTDDAYLLALATNTLLNLPAEKGAAAQAVRRLVSMQQGDGHWAGKDHSITRSTGSNLDVETSALALLALLKTGGNAAEIRHGVEWLTKSRSGSGTFGATQATVLALKALTIYAVKSRAMASSGKVSLRINGEDVSEQPYESGRKDALVFADLGPRLRPGKNTIELVHAGQATLPFAVAAEFRSIKPASHPDTVVSLATAIARTHLKMGETVRVTATLQNRTQAGQPMTLARVGIPGGLSFQNWQLKELVEKKIVDFYETRAREVILYLRQMAPGESRSVPLDLVASVPGEYTGPASQGYLYYTDDRRTWVDPLHVSIER